jgi:(S)-2-hydroxyglutarate dehydrogenase
MPADRYDVAVVGAGIVGLAVAREIRRRRPDSRVLVIDKQPAVAQHQTGHNSGVIHAGVYYQPGSLKARLCVTGSKLMYEYCAANGVPVQRCGKLIVAITDDELPRLADLEERGHANGVPGLRRVTGTEIRELEPQCRGVAALHSPATGIVDYAAVARAIEAELRAAGVEFALGTHVTGLRREHDTTVLSHPDGDYLAGWVIGCAGLWSDRLAVAAGAPAEPRVIPFRGAYLRIGADQPPVVNGLVYPVPDPALPFLGVHVTRHIDGDILLGPTALLVARRDGYRDSPARPAGPSSRPHPGSPARVMAHLGDGLRDAADTISWPGTWGVARRFWRTGLSELAMATSRDRFVKKCARYVPAIESVAIEPAAIFGIRAQAVDRRGQLIDDFTISTTPGVTHVRNAPSPAATSAFALASQIVTEFESASA